MLMVLLQQVSHNADGVVAAGGLATMLMVSQQDVGQNADDVAAGCWPE